MTPKKWSLHSRWKPPFSFHLVLVRLTPEVTANCEQGVKNLFDVIVKHAGDKVSVSSEQVGSASVTTLHLPSGVPYSPTVVRAGDVLLLASSDRLRGVVWRCCKARARYRSFLDPRLVEALAQQLPAPPEDSLVFFDGKQLFGSLKNVGQFIRDQKGDDPKAERLASMMDKIMAEVSIVDYAVTSESTDGQRNCKSSLVKMAADADSTALERSKAGSRLSIGSIWFRRMRFRIRL